jgi:multidrug resistance efflux pump
MVIMTTLYLILVWLIFFKLKLLPFNKFWKMVVLVIGIIIVNVFLSGLGTLTPPSSQATVSGWITEIAPQVSGRVVSVPVRPNEPLEPGDTLFQIDPLPYQYRVDQLTATLVQTEAAVAQLKESYDAARANVGAIEEQLALTRLRLGQQERLVATGAGNRQTLEQYQSNEAQQIEQLRAARANQNSAYLSLTAEVGDEQSQVAQVLAQLESAQYDLAQTTVRAPTAGAVTMLALRPGMLATSQRAVATFVHSDTLFVAALFPQKALENIEAGQTAKMNFPALPGRIFEGTVIGPPMAIGEAQFFASGQLHWTQEWRMTRQYPVMLTLPPDFPEELRKLGLAASVRIHTDQAGVVGIVALVLQWIQTSLDYII